MKFIENLLEILIQATNTSRYNIYGHIPISHYILEKKMNDWLTIAIITVVLVIIIGNLSTFQKNSKQPLRKKGLNDLKETLPRSHKKDHKMPTVNKAKK